MKTHRVCASLLVLLGPIVFWGFLVGPASGGEPKTEAPGSIKNSFSRGIHAVAQTYYVDNANGNDAWTGRSKIHRGEIDGPWKSIERANRVLKAGDTVLIGSGQYAETIRPNASGIPNQFIHYAAYPDDKVTILGDQVTCIDLTDRRYIKISGINCHQVERFLLMENGHYNIIEHCTFRNAHKYACSYLRNATHNQFRYNTFSSNPDRFKGADLLKLVSNNGGPSFNRESGDSGSDFNLIVGNQFGSAGHSGLTVRGKFNVIRGNLFENPHEKNVDISWQSKMRSPWATGDGELNLFERNTVRNAGPDFRYSGLSLSAPNNIVRFNVFYQNKGDGIEIATFGPPGDTAPFADNNRIYHNTFFDHRSYTRAKGKFRENNAIGCNEWNGSVRHTRIFNNIFYKNNDPPIQGFGWSTRIGPNQNLKERSHGASKGCLFPAIFPSKIEVDPLFVDEPNYDFRLQLQSPYVDQGIPIAVAKTRGSGKTIVLGEGDAYNFCNGYGVVEGDRIWVDKQEAVVVSIDYEADTLNLDRPLVWDADAAVTFPYYGKAPDNGAFQAGSNGGSMPTATPK